MAATRIDDLLKPIRDKDSSISGRTISEQFASDRSRIVFSSSFRRLMHKTQVFPLEGNSSVRNRLTHSIEVADVGQALALKIAYALSERKLITAQYVPVVAAVVENACLMHDIGNPPFGHFGETSIRRWFADKWRDHAAKALNEANRGAPAVDAAEPTDLLHFDGNPQGLRTVATLHTERDEYGLNLTYPTLLATIKYPGTPSNPAAIHKKKSGCFDSEAALLRRMWDNLGIEHGHRHPLVYITEAADDICYCLSDIADAFEKRIVGSREFKDFFRHADGYDPTLTPLPKEPIRYFSLQVSASWSRRIVAEVAEEFVRNIDACLSGEALDLTDNVPSGWLLKTAKAFARGQIYTSAEAQTVELAGHSAVYGLLEHFGHLLRLSRSDFTLFVEKGRQSGSHDLEWRLFNLLSERCVRAYRYAVSTTVSDQDEWIARAKLVVDHISGMTDSFALSLFQNLQGIRTRP